MISVSAQENGGYEPCRPFFTGFCCDLGALAFPPYAVVPFAAFWSKFNEQVPGQTRFALILSLNSSVVVTNQWLSSAAAG